MKKLEAMATGAVADVAAVFLFLAVGVWLSASLTAAIRTGADTISIAWPPRPGRIIFSLIIATMLIATTDLIQGGSGKLALQARVRRYASAFYSGVTWRLLIEAL